MPRIRHDDFRKERKRSGIYRRIEGTLDCYICGQDEARLFVSAQRGMDKEEHEIDATPFIGDLHEGKYDGRGITVLARQHNGGLHAVYIEMEPGKRGREPECFKGSGLVVLPKNEM